MRRAAKSRWPFFIVGAVALGLGLVSLSIPINWVHLVGPVLVPVGLGLLTSGLLPAAARTWCLVILGVVMAAFGILGPALLGKSRGVREDGGLLLLFVATWLMPAGVALVTLALGSAALSRFLQRRDTEHKPRSGVNNPLA